MGAGRVTKRKPGFIDSVVEATVAYYAEVVQNLQAFVPKAPAITAPASSSQPAEETTSASAE